MNLTITMLDNEHWWGGTVTKAEIMPFDKNTEIVIDLVDHRGTLQSAPLFLSDKGRYVWSEKGFVAKFKNGEITFDGESRIFLDECGKTLRDAFVNAKKDRFPFIAPVRIPRDFFKYPQFNTWMELVKEQTEDNIAAYAEELAKNGYNRGVLIIDDGWQQNHGIWKFHSSKFKDPKALIKKLHGMGFKVMLWVSPYFSPDSEEFTYMSRNNGVEGNTGHFVRLKDGRVAIYKWWNGFSAMLDFTSAEDRNYMKEQLDVLMDEYGVDGFKFDGGDYTGVPVNLIEPSFVSSDVKNDDPMFGEWRKFDTETRSKDDLNRAWIEFGTKYAFHEFKNTWKTGDIPVVQRLVDKSHVWGVGGLASLIPQSVFIGLTGNPFVCPDMVGGGRWITFVYGKAEEELFVRMAECSALFPMMQYSALPWRKLSQRGADLCLNAAELHEKMYDVILAETEKAEKTGEPIIRNMEYVFPNSGYAKISDQFMLGETYLVAPVIQPAVNNRTVIFPEGRWKDMYDGKIYEGGSREVPAPIEKLPFFERV